ncbi:unnamed protein product [Mytilus edulis]|uniref:Uncharacterized protein n=1 Tax=Mytilus edulis TaxID=6550 RepID=A0A8S3VMQ3_MYTED|nr:unnamed protein product [Mytilus edulis]
MLVDEPYGDTPLHAAAEGGFINIVKLLLERADIDPKKENKPNKTLLHSAARGGNLDIVELLLERADIDPNGENKYGSTPLHRAVKGGFINIVQFLLERADIDPNKTDKAAANFVRYLHIDITIYVRSRPTANAYKSFSTNVSVNDGAIQIPISF